MNEIIEINSKKIDGSLPILVLNKSMEDIEKEVLIELSKDCYSSPVTMQNFSSMKESSQFLGKVAKQISDFRIAKVKEESQQDPGKNERCRNPNHHVLNILNSFNIIHVKNIENQEVNEQ